MEDNVKYHGPSFDVVVGARGERIVPHELEVIVMPFERDSSSVPTTVGLVDGRALRVPADGEDPDVLGAAKRGLKAVGYDADDIDRWCFLGMVRLSPLVDQDQPCLACDVTGLDRAGEEGDGFELRQVKAALDSTDAAVQAAYLKTFRYIYGSALGQRTDVPLEPSADGIDDPGAEQTDGQDAAAKYDKL